MSGNNNALDIFNNDAFSFTSLTARANTELGYVPGQMGALGIFEEDGINTRTAMVESRDGALSIVAPSKIGGPGETIGRKYDGLRSFPVPHFQRDDSVLAEEVQGRRAFGSMNEVETVQSVVDRKMARHFRDFDTTLEFMKVGAAKGIILDKAGNTIFNLYTEFGISEPADYNFDFATSSTICRQKSEALLRQIEDEVDANYDSVHGICGDTFWDTLVNHKSNRDVWMWAQQVAQNQGRSSVNKIEIGGILYERYRTGKKGKTAGTGGAAGAFIADGECRFVVKGVPELFIVRFAPADYMETVNTDGLPRYVKLIPMDNGKGMNMEVQTNPLCLCTRPSVLRKGVISA